MIPADLSARLRMIAEVSFFDSEPPVQGTARVREIQARLPELLPGQRFTATLQRPLPDGTFQALIAGRSYTLALSHAAKAGDTLELIVTHSGPRAVVAQLVNPASAAAAAATAAGTGNTNLSTTGRLISFLLTGQPTPQPAALAGGRPLLDSPPANNGALLAPVLRKALTQSGLFYESHQSQWVAGKRDMASLLREPQGQQPAPRGTMPFAAGSTGGAAALLGGANPSTLVPGASGSTPPGTSGLLPPSAGPSGSVGAPGLPAPSSAPSGSPPPAAGPPVAGSARIEFSAAATNAPAEAFEEVAAQNTAPPSATQRLPLVPERLMPLVHQQLDALATQNYVWHGQVWPGQFVEWEIEDPERDARGDEEGNPDWNTKLRLTLPRLGGLEARLHLTAAGIAVRLVADEEHAVAAIDAARARLDEALAAADVPLTGFVAERRDATG